MEGTSALIIAGSAQLRDSLPILLKAIPHMEIIHQAADGPAALSIAMDSPPTLVLLDYDLAQDDAGPTLRRIKQRWPYSQVVALVDNDGERRSADDAGAAYRPPGRKGGLVGALRHAGPAGGAREVRHLVVLLRIGRGGKPNLPLATKGGRP